MPSHQHRRSRPVSRSRGMAPVDTRRPEEIALSRAIMLARTLRWREEWQAEVAARVAAKSAANGHAAGTAMPRPPRRANGTAGEFADAIARNELGRFYWSGAQEEALTAARKDRKPKQRPRKATPD